MNDFLTRILIGIFGSGIEEHVVGSLSWADLLAAGVWLLLVAAIHIAFLLYGVHAGKRRTPSGEHSVLYSFWVAVAKPLYAILWVFSIKLLAAPIIPRMASGMGSGPWLAEWFERMLRVVLLAALIWLAYRLIAPIEARLLALTRKSASTWDDFIVAVLGNCARMVVPVMALILALPAFHLPPGFDHLLSKGSSLLIIGAISWVLFRSVGTLERFILAKHDITVRDNLEARKVHTQIRVLSKTLYVLIGIFAVASALMVFEQVRQLGGSILASAGVLGIIVGFAAQRTIANLFAGFQLAMTQPIRIDDVVIVEGEWGRVEEITLTYVVVCIWDERRLVVPLGHFIEKPFQNWTRVSASLLGSVMIWVDYSLPINRLRQEIGGIIETCAAWDRRFWNLQVTEATERAMQIRVLATAADSSKAWDLRCEIRERLIALIQEHYPASLPKARADLKQMAG